MPYAGAIEGVGAVSQQTHAIGPRERTPGHLGQPGLEPGIERSYQDASSIRGAEEARPGPRTDVRTVRLAGRAQYAPLLEAGVRIYEWQPTTLHAKTFVADGVWATIGSINFDNRSLTLNDESTLMILDGNIGQQMNAVFLDDLNHAEEITLSLRAPGRGHARGEVRPGGHRINRSKPP